MSPAWWKAKLEGDELAEPILTRAALREAKIEPLHIARNLTKADVFALEWPPQSGIQVVIKDLKKRPLWFRLLLGRFLMAREWCALQALQGIEGVPFAVARLDADAFAMTRSYGTPLMEFKRNQIDPKVVETIATVLHAAHARGVTHGDLHRDNILVTPEGAVTIIDWATACVFAPSSRALKLWTRREWLGLDRRAIAKLRARYAAEFLTNEERDLLERGGSPLYRTVREFGFRVRRLLGHKKAKSSKHAAKRYTKWTKE